MSKRPPASRTGPKSLQEGVPSDLPEWITPELIEKTLEVWQPHYSDPLTAADAAYIIFNVGRLVETLSASSEESSSEDQA